jgi:hypothetical protein
MAAFNGCGGVPKLTEFAKENPGEFLRLWVRVLPGELRVEAKVETFDANGLAERLEAARKFRRSYMQRVAAGEQAKHPALPVTLREDGLPASPVSK